MKTFLRFTIATAFLLMTELGCFAQHYNQTNLVSDCCRRGMHFSSWIHSTQ
jgi:hypothetical protein